jgi:hypothetical protein
MPDGSWDVRMRDIDPKSPCYGAILRATVAPKASKQYDLHYELRIPDSSVKPAAITSPLHRKITELNSSLVDLGEPPGKLPTLVGLHSSGPHPTGTIPKMFSLQLDMSTTQVDSEFQETAELFSQSEFAVFRKNLDHYEASGDFGSKAVHPGTNLIGPNRVLPSYVEYYHRTRTHLSLDKDCPESRPIMPRRIGKVVEIPQVGGLHHRYERLAA